MRGACEIQRASLPKARTHTPEKQLSQTPWLLLGTTPLNNISSRSQKKKDRGVRQRLEYYS